MYGSENQGTIDNVMSKMIDHETRRKGPHGYLMVAVLGH